MNITDKDVKKLTLIILIVLLLVLVYVIVKPVLIASIGGLILAYMFTPFYKKVTALVKNRTLAATLVSFTILICLFVVLWFIIPLIMQQVFEIFSYSQKFDAQKFIKVLFPHSAERFIVQLSVTINELIGKASSTVLNSLLDVFLELPNIMINLFVAGFVFFFALRDAQQFNTFFKGLSPFSEAKEKVLVKHFKDVTDSVIYGQIIVGIVQGLLAGIGFLAFGVDNALVLTLLAIFFSIIPFIGPAIVWIPVAVYLFSSGNDTAAFIYLAYNILIVSLVDNFLRSYLVSRKTNLSPALIMIGMIGGIYIFGILGLVIGPLALAYLLTLVESFKDKSLYSLFVDGA